MYTIIKGIFMLAGIISLSLLSILGIFYLQENPNLLKEGNMQLPNTAALKQAMLNMGNASEVDNHYFFLKMNQEEEDSKDFYCINHRQILYAESDRLVLLFEGKERKIPIENMLNKLKSELGADFLSGKSIIVNKRAIVSIHEFNNPYNDSKTYHARLVNGEQVDISRSIFRQIKDAQTIKRAEIN
ncbi:DNA-binding protein, LytTr [Saprospira grandis DSM 2844]|uniref:DNA-binding protein, LytTr n=1 Tax=Saprospira grandis DSM 2844 TaxID=694433 RepID=J0XY78_9BACT|nr:LytTR family transcriptional regulator DNA-binding domain-containing protein [Saprospira grandis]EJF54091.1 DNA-binding protein, LytTr [Saprospira grandis DSM 2844]